MHQHSGEEKRPQISIIVAFLNAEMFIEETLLSVVNQTLEDWELILVNDGSTDQSEKLVKAIVADHADRMHYLTHESLVNKGVCASRNLGVGHARGQFLAFLDADDVWLPEKLEAQSAILRANADVGMVLGAPRYWRSWEGSGRATPRDFIPKLGLRANSLYTKPELLMKCHPLGRAIAPCPSDIMLRRELVKQIGGFEEAFTGDLQMYEDQAFLAKAYLATNTYVSGSTWTNYRLHSQSCCYRVTSSGAEAMVRRFYFDWLIDYLNRNNLNNEQIQRAIDKAIRPGRAVSVINSLDKPRSAFRAFLTRRY